MNFKEHIKNFNKRWNIASSKTFEEAFCEFKQRIVNIFQDIKLMCGDIDTTYYLTGIDDIVTEESYLDFCQYYSIQKKLGARPGFKGALESLAGNNCKITIIDRLNNETDEKEFYRLIEVIFSLQIRKGFSHGEEVKQFLIKKVKEAVEMSDVNVILVESKNGIILYPKGEKKLDEELVNKPMAFLNTKSNKHFIEALKFYQNKNPIKSAESLRRSLEEFLRYKLESPKGLKENINCLQKKLKQEDSQSEVRNVIFQTFNYLDKYFNEHSKHKDGNIKEPENEFLIYQTGLLMRYIDKIDNFQKKQ